MPEQLLQLGQGHFPHHGMGRKGVPEVVESEVLDLRPPERQFECGTDPVPAGAVGLLEQAPQPLPGVRLESDQGIVHGCVDRDAPRLARLGAVEGDPRGGQVHQLPLEPEDLSPELVEL